MNEVVSWQDAHQAQDVLRIFDGRPTSGGPGRLTADLRLSEFVTLYYKPVHLVMRDARPRHLEEVDQSVKYWVRFTGDPPLGAISVYHSRDFVVRLRELAGRNSQRLSANTVRKHCTAVQAILDLCGPADRRHRDAVGILDSVPYLPRPRREDSSRVDQAFTFDEVQQLVDHAHVATLPAHLPCTAGEYLARLYVLLFNTGVRIGGAMGATWRHYHGTHLVLRARVAAKGFRDLRVELNDAARRVVEAMRGGDAERIFPWPAAWPASRHSLYKQHHAVCQCLPAERQFGFHAFRRLHTEMLDAINPAAVQMALGWTTGRTANEFYRGRRLVASSVAQLPALRPASDRQRLLFD